MAIEPTGLPAWVRSNDHTSYGGNVSKKNYQSAGAINPQTDVDAANWCRIATDLAAVAKTSPFAVMRFLCNDAVPGAPTIQSYSGMIGTQPTAARNGNGDVQFTWAASYEDPYGVEGIVDITMAIPITHGSTAAIPTVEISDSNSDTYGDRIRVRVKDTAGAAISDAVVTLVVWTGGT